MFNQNEIEQINSYIKDLQHSAERDQAKMMKYSGRGMYGRYCVGFACSNPIYMVVNMLAHFAEMAMDAERDGDPEAEEAPEERQLYDKLARILTGNVCYDSLGYDSVVYFPNWEWDDAFKEEDEDYYEDDDQ